MSFRQGACVGKKSDRVPAVVFEVKIRPQFTKCCRLSNVDKKNDMQKIAYSSFWIKRKAKIATFQQFSDLRCCKILCIFE